MTKKLLMLFAVMFLFLSGCQDVSEGTPAPALPAESQNTETTEPPAHEKTKEKDKETIVILHTNDVHCGLDNRIGYDGLYLYKEEMKQEYENVLLVDAGDAIQGGIYGTLSNGKIIIDLMNDVGYDCATIGNHEFDYGFEVLDDLSEELKCGYICANFCTSDGEPVFAPYRIFELAGKKIAMIGADTPSTFTKSKIHTIVDDAGIPMYDFMADETGDRLAQCIQKYVDEVRGKGADIVILMAHLGNSEKDDPRFRSETVMSKLHGIDLLIDAHEHAKAAFELKDGEGRPVKYTQAGTKLRSIGKILIHPDNTITTEFVDEIPQPEGIDAKPVTRGKKEYWVDPGINRKIAEYTSEYEGLLNRKIGETSFDLPVSSEEEDSLAKSHETGLMNLYTDALCELSESDVSMYNGGGIREGFMKGDILYSDCLDAFPYGNDILVMKMKGQLILDVLEFGARKLPLPNNGLIHSRGIEYTADLSVPSSVKEDSNGTFISIDGPYRVKDVLINGEPLDLNKEYAVAMPTFLQECGDGFSMMKDAEILRYTQKVEYSIIAEYIEQTLGGVIPEKYKSIQNRIKVIGFTEKKD
ncbi:MAG: bifunctional metallophosphatase/5'-nucleotidase [Solobacterium sp.]|nr:bifunctional metallophosphatase/5'-nucleotidase [Solobacterium sp.]